MSRIGDRFLGVHERVQHAAQAAGRGDAVTLVAVSKWHPARALAEAFEAGARDFGESYVQEMVEKRDRLHALLGPRATEVRWHFIGHLQRNKVKHLGAVHLVHTVDSAKLMKTIRSRGDAVEGVLIQVRIGGESSKSGVDPAEVSNLLRAVPHGPGAPIRGLMTIPPPRPSSVEARRDFGELRTLRDRLATDDRALPHLSMGMSADYADAIAEGATLVRVGTAIFGARE